MRPLGFCRYLPDHGWVPSVVTTDVESVQPSLGVDDALMRKLPPAIDVRRVPHGNTLLRLIAFRAAIRRRFRAGRRDAAAAQDGSATVERSRFDRTKDAVLEWLFEFPDPQREWHRAVLSAPEIRTGAIRPDLVYATGGPWTSLLVGRALARRFGVPLVTDFRDPWTRNPFARSKSRMSFNRARALERSVCESSFRVVANTPELRDQLAADYPDLAERFLTISNGFDISDTLPADEAAAPAGVELTHFGTVYHNRNPIELLRAIADVAAGGATSRHLSVRFVGAWLVDDPAANELARSLEARGFVRRDPAVPHAECLRQMRQSAVLLILQPAFPVQIPAKIYEYIAVGRPMVVVGGEGATAALVERHALGVCRPNDREALASLLRDLIAGRRQLDAPPRDVISRFDYRHLSRELAGVFDAAVAAVPA
jgi:glycosyltransferase involved in cell wall biosynthesis